MTFKHRQYPWNACLLFLTLFAFLWSCCEVIAAPSFEAPQLRVSEKPYYLGKHLKGEIFETEISVFNDGDAPLHLKRIVPKCSCIRILNYEKVVAPGESIQLHLRVDTNKVRTGREAKKINIFSDDPVSPRTHVWFNIEVRACFVVEPKSLIISGLFNVEKTLRLVLRSANNKAFDIKSFTSEKKFFQIKSTKALSKSRVEVVLVAKANDKIEKLLDRLIVDAQFQEGGPTVTRPLDLKVDHLDFIQITPASAVVFKNKDTDPLLEKSAKPIKKTITILSALPSLKFKIIKLELQGVPPGSMRTEIRTIEEGQRYEVDVIIDKYQKKTFIRGKLVIQTDSKRSALKEIPVQAMFGKRIRHR